MLAFWAGGGAAFFFLKVLRVFKFFPPGDISKKNYFLILKILSFFYLAIYLVYEKGFKRKISNCFFSLFTTKKKKKIKHSQNFISFF